MKKGIAIWTTTLLGLAVAQTGIGSTIEHSVDASVLGVIPVIYGDHTINSSLASASTGSYIFEAQAGDAVRVVAAGHTNDFDPRIELRDPSGAVINSTYCSSPSYSRCSTQLSEALGTTGTHYINVSDVDANNAGSYTMHLDLYPPSDPMGNNWDGLGYYNLVNDSLGHAGDHDIFGFWGANGSGVSVSVDGLTQDLDSSLQIWGPSGDPALFDSYCSSPSYSSCSVTASLDLVEDGLYLMALSDAGFNNIGSYNLELACTYGDCPVDRAAPPVPVPAAAWLFASALGFTGFWFRKRKPTA
ncbi:MAG: hypothetical protein ABW080_10320 [Candidatus Thiodiazotropha sp.]